MLYTLHINPDRIVLSFQRTYRFFIDLN